MWKKTRALAPRPAIFFVTDSYRPLTYPHIRIYASPVHGSFVVYAQDRGIRAKSLIHIDSKEVHRNEASQAQGPNFKGLARLTRPCPQSYPQIRWIGFEGFLNQPLSAEASSKNEHSALSWADSESNPTQHRNRASHAAAVTVKANPRPADPQQEHVLGNTQLLIRKTPT